MPIQKKIPGYFIQKNVQDQLTAVGYVFGVIGDMTGLARKRTGDTEIQEFFQRVVQRLLSIGESLKGRASALGDKTLTSIVPVTLIKDNIDKQFQSSQQIFRTVQDIANFGKSRQMDEELLAVLEASARRLIEAGEMLSSSASETGDQLLYSIAVD